MKIENNGTIIVNRGEAFSVPLFIDCGDKFHTLQYSLEMNPREIVYLGVMTYSDDFENSFIRKRFTIKDINEKGDIIVTFKQIDTKDIPAGKYYYQFILRDDEDDITPLTEKREFIII